MKNGIGNIHLWLILLNVVSLFFIMQIVFGLLPLWECSLTDEKVERINSFIVDLSLGITTSTFFYYLLVYYGERKRSKGVRRLIQWRLDAMAANMQVVICYYVYKCDIDCEDFKFLTLKQDSLMKADNLTREELKYWFRWENSDVAINVSGSTERGFVCNYIDLVKHHAERIMKSSVFSLEDTKLMELVDRIGRCELVNHISMLNHNSKIDVYLGNYGKALTHFYQYYCELLEYSKTNNLMAKEGDCRLGIPFVYN